MSPTKSERVAVVIVHLSGYNITSGCLQSLRAVSYPALDIILVDNGSVDGSGTQLAAAFPEVTLLRSEVNAGFTGGNNLGMAHALEKGYTYILLLNNDTFVAPGFLEPLVNYLEHNPGVAAVQPLIFFNHDRELIWNAGSFYNRVLGYTYTRGLLKRWQPVYGKQLRVDWITGCAFMVRSEALRATGLFATAMFLYYEDVDLSFRLRKMGYQLACVPQSVIYHIAGASGKKQTKEGSILPQIHFYNLRNRIWLLKKYTPWYRWPLVAGYNGMYVLALLAYFIVRGRKQKLKAALSAIGQGVSGSIDVPCHPMVGTSTPVKARL